MQTKIQEKMAAYGARKMHVEIGDTEEGRKGGGREEGREENSFLALKKTKKSTDDP